MSYPPPNNPYGYGGYPPPQQGMPGAYPPQQPGMPGAYPPQQPGMPQGYPPQQGYPGYPPQQYPPQGMPQGYPPQPGYPPQGMPQGYPPQPGYPPQQGVPQGYPPQQGAPQGYPPQQGAPQGYGGFPTYPAPNPANTAVLATAGVQAAPNANLYISTVTVSQPYPNAEADAEAVQKAMKGIGTDDKTLSNIIATRTRDQLVQVATVFQKKFGKTLEHWIKGDTSGGYQDLLLALIMPKADYDAFLVHNAVAGLGTDDDQLIETLCTRNNQEIKDMKAAYTRLYKKEIEKDVAGDTSFHYKELLLAILRAERPETTTVNVDEVKKDAMFLYQQGEGRMGTNERAFIDILTHRSFPHLQLIGQQYANISGHSLESGIAKETSGNFKKAMITLITPRDEYFADSIHRAIAGAGTDDHKMIRALSYISNTKEMTKAVNNVYVHKYKHNLANDVGGDTSGWYKKTAQALITTRTAL